MKHADLAIVGGGIVGLAHAVHAVRAGLSVSVFERSPSATGASIRNFGMLAIIAQNAGPELDSASRALEHWRTVAASADIAMAQNGCLFVANAPEELAVLEEFATIATRQGRDVKLLTRDQAGNYAPDLQQDNLLGGLWTPEAWKVDQRHAMTQMTNWLQDAHNVTFHFSTEVQAVRPPQIETNAGTFECDHVLVCGGDEFATLFPKAFRETGVTRCQLQMMRTAPQPGDWRLKPFLLGGLSMTRYSAIADCPSLPALKAHQQAKLSNHLVHGIHVIACQEFDGSITIGDSHTYGTDGHMPRSKEIDELILSELARMITLPEPEIASRWIGNYAHLPGVDALRLSPIEGATIVTLTNGQGMTHAFALAGDVIADLTR